MNSTSQIYELKLRYGHYYVGKTDNLERRFDEHLAGEGSEWTHLHPVACRAPIVIPGSTGLDEDRHVKYLMSKYGIDKVRGGTYSQIELSDMQIAALEAELAHTEDRCHECGDTDHFVRDCPQRERRPTSSSPPKRARFSNDAYNLSSICFRCGRTSHLQSTCYARTHIDGYELTREGPVATCFRCGRRGHQVRSCYARRHVDGSYLNETNDDTNLCNLL